MRPRVSHFLALTLALGLLGASPAFAGYYDNITQWVKGGDGFSIAWPVDFDQSQDGAWRLNSGAPGKLLLRTDIPRAIESQTNFGGADLTVGRSGDAKALAACLKPEDGERSAKATRINGVGFAAFTASDAGMSHYQDSVSYRAIRGGQCWALEYVIRSTALGVYDPALGLKPFNLSRVKALLERMVRTFRFA
jgi:hypothetical protein